MIRLMENVMRVKDIPITNMRSSETKEVPTVCDGLEMLFSASVLSPEALKSSKTARAFWIEAFGFYNAIYKISSEWSLVPCVSRITVPCERPFKCAQFGWREAQSIAQPTIEVICISQLFGCEHNSLFVIEHSRKERWMKIVQSSCREIWKKRLNQ